MNQSKQALMFSLVGVGFILYVLQSGVPPFWAVSLQKLRREFMMLFGKENLTLKLILGKLFQVVPSSWFTRC
ncbi:hypothetical protein CUMW_262210 [Citrus unshiu]|uniref:Uncharacterized protein n=1 Tax=Citrus unshiu TaxID=55188 RepID=A0A2H5QUD8_CITUN|nr:hypothetical protein CUMW_262210 [Citrus unshiu]